MTSEILMPGIYSRVNILEVDWPQYTRGVDTHGVSVKSLLNLQAWEM